MRKVLKVLLVIAVVLTVLVALGFSAACAVGLAPFFSAGEGLVESLLVYAAHWRFNGSLFLLADGLLGGWPWLRTCLYVTIGAVCLASAWIPVSRPARYMLALGAYLALAPTVYPWYLLGIAALASLYPGPLAVTLPAVVGLSDLVFVSKITSGAWKVPTVAHRLEYGLLSGLLLVGLARRLWAKASTRAATSQEAGQ